jgi:hypothetical protein
MSTQKVAERLLGTSICLFADEGIWIVSFMDHDLGFVDLEQKTLQPPR